LLDGGCFLSFGPRFNPETLNATPLGRLLIETDEAPVTILEVASLVAQASHLTTDQVISQASANACRILGVGPVNV
jgi:Tat protein secretion system quality control protein TatD with DNase activity